MVRWPLAILLAAMCSLPTLAWADGRWRDLPPEERVRMREQMREHWQTLPPEERQRIRESHRQRQEQRQERGQEWHQGERLDLSPDERRRLRDELRSRRRGE